MILKFDVRLYFLPNSKSYIRDILNKKHKLKIYIKPGIFDTFIFVILLNI